MDDAKRQLMEIIRPAFSDILAALTLLVVSTLAFLNMFNVVKNPLFSSILGILFIYLALGSIHINDYHNGKKHLLNFDFNGMIFGVSLILISLPGFMGHVAVVRNFLFPLVIGLLLMTVAIARSYLKATNPDIVIHWINLSGIVGGQALIFYSFLIYMDLTSLTQSPIFPLSAAAALYTAFLIDILPQVRINQTGINKANRYLDEIEEKISNLKNEFKCIKFNNGDPGLMKSFERLNTIHLELTHLKKTSDSLTLHLSDGNNVENSDPHSVTSSDKHDITFSKTRWEVPEQGKKLGAEMNSGEIDELVGENISDKIFFEKIQKEFEIDGLGSIIKEAREIRNSINAHRNALG